MNFLWREIMNWWKKFKKGLFTTSQNITGITLALIGTSALVYAFNVANLITFHSGDTISAQEINNNFNYLNERLAYLAKREVAVSNNTPVTITSGTTTPIDFNNVIVDFSGPAAEGDQIVQNDVYNIPENGKYSWTISGSVQSMTFGTANVYLYAKTVSTLTSTSANAYGYIYGTGNYNMQFSGSATATLNSGDQIIFEKTVSHWNGTSGDTATLNPGIKFSIKKVD